MELVISSAWFTVLNPAFSSILLTFGNVGSPVLFPPHLPPSKSFLLISVSCYVTTHPSDPGFASYALLSSHNSTMYGSLACGLRLIVFFFLPRSSILRYPLLSSVSTDFRVRFHNLKSIISCGRPTFMKSLKKYPLVSVLLSGSGHLFQCTLQLKYTKVLSSHTLIIAALYRMAWPNSLVRNFKNFKIVLSELSPNLAIIRVPDIFLTRLVGKI